MAGLQAGYRFKDAIPIQLGDLVFGQVDQEGVHWHCGTLEGWDSPDVRAQITQREADHGAWAGPVYLNERVITLAGKAFAPDAPTLDRAIERLLVAASLTDTTLTVNESIPKQCVVRRSGKVLAQRLTGTALDWSVLVTAADPRRYGTELRQQSTALPSTSGGLAPPLTPPLTVAATTVSGDITATNEGTIAVRPILTITGPVPAPRIPVVSPDGTVRTLVYSETLGAGEQLVIDTDRHTVMLGGASRRRYLSGPWPDIPAGATVAIQYRADTYNPTTKLTATWRPAWM
ncbi:hypothetical protein ACF09J_07635 [Streptomyces sp. NPDC014889]|uniref:hypothetical protein n=1 Tax=Streptomyces sp. NPDC014889 TaxID=3364928 RepID=UPI0036FDF6BC